TGDDEARLRPQFQRAKEEDFEKELKPQARPNVLFEAGYALAKYPRRAIIVQIGEVRPFSDIAGRFMIHFDGSPSARHHVVARLKAAEVQVDTSGADWLTAGSFECG